MKIKQLSETTAGAVASVAMPLGSTHKRTEEAANPAQQAAIAIAMKKAGKKPKKLKENDEGYAEINPKNFLDDDFYMFDPETKVLKGTWGYKSVGRRYYENEARQKGYEVVSGMKAKNLGLRKKTKVDEGGFDIPEIPRAPQPKPTPNKMDEYMEPDSGARAPSKPIENPMDAKPYEPKGKDPESYMFKANMEPDKGATPPKTPIEKPMDTKPYVEPKNKKDPRSYMTKESSIFKGVSEAHISEEELLLSPGQGIRFKTELMPKRTDHEVEMARNQLRVAAQSAKRIYQNIKDLSEIQGLDGWVQAKITKASDYLDAVNNYIEGKKQMLEIQDAVDEQVAGDQVDQALTAQYSTPQAQAKTQTIDKAFASGDEAEFQRLGIQSPQQIERDYQTMLGKEKEQDAALMRNPKLTPSARPAQRYNPKGIPIRETDIEETKRLSTREKFKRSLKRAGYDPDAGADRLLNLIARQAEERKEFERKQKEQDAEFYGRRKDVDEGLKFHGGFPDVDHMRGAVHRDADMITDNVKTNNKKDWDRAVDSINARVFDDMSDFYSDSKGERVVGNSAVWAKWDNETQTGWFNAKGRPLKPWPVKEQGVAEDWQKTNRRDKTSGMSRRAVKQYRRENPGSKLQTAVTTKPSKLKKGSKSAKRRKSFCSRMRGMKKSRTSAKTARDPNSNINKALRRWNCESVEEMRNLVMLAEQKIAMAKEEQGLEENLHKWFKEKWVRFGPDGKIRGDCARGDDSEGKPKCLPQSKAHSLGKKGRASAAARKRREDPNPERSGAAINVATKKKSNEGVAEGSEILKVGSSVRVPHKGKMVSGKIVRYDSGKGGYSPAYVVDIGEYESKLVPVHNVKQGVAEGEVTRTKTGLKHKATDKYGAGEDPEGFNQKYARDLTSLSKSEVKRLDNIHGVKWKNRGSKGVAEDFEPEGKTVKNSLHTIIRVATHLERQIDDSEDFSEWESEIIGSVKDQIVKVMDYEISKKEQQGVAEGSKDDIEDTRQFRNAIALAKSQKAIRQAKDGKDAKYYADGTKVTPDEVARRAAERKAKKQDVTEGHEMCPECGGAMYSEEMINEKKDACYYKVKSRYKVWPSAYASGALVKCRNKGAKNWGNKSK